MRVQVRSLSGVAEVVEITASAKLGFERARKKPVSAEIESGMVEAVYDVTHRSLRHLRPDDTPEEFEDWLAGVADVVLLPGDVFGYFLAVCEDMDADQTEHTAELVKSIAELKRANAAMPEPEVPTGGDPTASQVESPEPPSGQASTRRASSPSKRKSRTSTAPSK